MGPSTSTSGLVLLIFLSALCFASVVQSQITHPDEVKALKAVKLSLNDPMKKLNDWNRGDPCTSNWTGVFCFDQPRTDGYLHLNKLQLMNMHLSGTLSPELGKFSELKILNFMWNNLGGSIPEEIGNLTYLKYLFLCGNQLTGPLPDKLGNLTYLERLHVDLNKISGPLPKSLANLDKLSHLHLNDNSISGEIPHEMSRLPSLLHFGLDNNNLSGSLPAELSKMPKVVLFQLDNNNFSGSEIPTSYGNMSALVKLSLRNCGLQGSVPDFSNLANLSYIDLSLNQLSGPIPSVKLADGMTTVILSQNNLNGTIPETLLSLPRLQKLNLSRNQLSGPIPSEKLADSMTTIILSHNNLNGNIPETFSSLPHLQTLALDDNFLSGSVPSSLWQSRRLNAAEKLTLDFQYNKLTNFSGSSIVPENVNLLLEGNRICSLESAAAYCGSQTPVNNTQDTIQGSDTYVSSSICQPWYECAPIDLVSSAASASSCYCAAPLIFDFRLVSPGFSDFLAYQIVFEKFMASGLNLNVDQLNISSLVWEVGPRLKMIVKLFPAVENGDNNLIFNVSDVQRLWAVFTEWKFNFSDLIGPYELVEFIILDPYKADFPQSTSSILLGLSKGGFVGVIVGAISVAVVLSASVSYLIIKMNSKKKNVTLKRYDKSNRAPVEVEGVRRFTYEEMALATSQFSCSVEIGKGGYGKVYKGALADGALVAIKRAQEGSLQGNKEFLTEIKILSRLHHKHLVSLVGYCDDKDEQMLVYEFMPNGSLRDHLSAKSKKPLSFTTRLRIALGSARGILYLHTEADPPIFHRDIKSTNILLDSKFSAKVADFGLSRLAPEPDIDGIVPINTSTVVKGTPGYLDPEYLLTRKFTDKSDVYGIGVVFLEILTSMQPISFRGNIVREVYTAYKSGKILSIVDDRMGAYPHEQAERFATLAIRCCQEESAARPLMAEVVRELEAIMHLAPERHTSSSIEHSYGSQSKGDLTPIASSVMKNPFVSYDLYGSELASGRFSQVAPR